MGTKALRSLSAVALICMLSACKKDRDPPPDVPDAGSVEEVTVSDGDVGARVTLDPFTVTVFGPDGDVLTTAPQTIGLVERETKIVPPLLPGFEGFDHADRTDRSRLGTGTVALISHDAASVRLLTATAVDTDVVTMIMVMISADDGVVRIEAAAATSPEFSRYTAADIAFSIAEDEKFVGMGERESSVDHRGKTLYNWTEEGGIGGGESAVPGPTNPFPNGEGMTHLPVPFFISSGGYGAWLDTTYRSEFAFGSDVADELRITTDEPRIALTIAPGTPSEIIQRYTDEVGRATLPAPWVFGPRKRINADSMVDGVPVIEALRERRIPMTGAFDAMHVLPHGAHIGREEELRAWNVRLEQLGYKGIAYLNAHVSTERPGGAGYLEHGRSHDIFVKNADGSEFRTGIISGGQQDVVTIDLSSPSGVHFFEEVMAETLDLGYDGWMLDFGEYLAYETVLADGRTGWEAHNAFPLLMQSVTKRYLDDVRPNDHFFYVRSGYAGTQALVPMVWSGDPSASFEPARGLPAQVRAGISAGLSGIPFWGSDGTGFTCLFDGPAGKDVSLRWVAFAALSPDMHEQDACARRPEGTRKWTMWDDEESTTVYAGYTGLHTRLFPYIYAHAKEATRNGMPIMRHALLMHSSLPDAWKKPQEEYYFGSSLYVAPVVTRDATDRTFWLPPGEWFDWWTREAVSGGRMVTRAVPWDEIPLYQKAGTMVPLLDEDVQTLATTDNPSVVDMADRADVIDMRVALTAERPLAGWTDDVSAFDAGFLASYRSDTGPLTIPDGFAEVDDESLLRTCDRCAMMVTLPDGTVRFRASSSDGIATDGLSLLPPGNDKPAIVRWDVLVR